MRRFRVSFYWIGADLSLDGCVPHELTEPVNPQRVAMRAGSKLSECRKADCQEGTVWK